MRTLKQRLILVNIAATGAALLVAVTLLFGAELRTWRDALVRDISIKADVIGNQSTAALIFNAPADAEEILGALRADGQIEYAALYSRNGMLFAAYHSAGAKDRAPRTPPQDGHALVSDHLDLTRSILLRNERIGTITIRASLHQFRARMLQYVLGLSVIVLLSLAAASVLLTRLQRTVTAPVTDLVRAMEAVSRDKDYAGRADGAGTEEFVTLADGFNTMLSAIQSRDRDLERSLVELKKAYEKLESLDRLKSDFISTVSHELRTPITSIKAFVELLLIKPDMRGERQKKMLETISIETDRFARLIGDLLDLSNIESGGIHWRDQDVALQDVVRAAISGILPLAQKKDIRIEEQLEVGLAPVHVDRDRLMQVVMNLMSNAIKFMPAKGRITVTTTRVASPPGVAVSVADTGCGIPSRDLVMIFEKFQRSGDVLTSAVEGSGLGLSICKLIVEHYDGRIWAVSEEGKGSTFTFVIPITGPSPEPAEKGSGADSSEPAWNGRARRTSSMRKT
jgi:signal transduction histidine kinase